MKILKLEKIGIKRKWMSFGIFMYSTMCAAVPALAAGDTGAISSGIKSGLSSVYDIIKAIVLPIGALALAICAIEMIWGSDRAAEKAKGYAIRIVIAVALVYGAGLIVNEVGTWFSGLGDGGVFS